MTQHDKKTDLGDALSLDQSETIPLLGRPKAAALAARKARLDRGDKLEEGGLAYTENAKKSIVSPTLSPSIGEPEPALADQVQWRGFGGGWGGAWLEGDDPTDLDWLEVRLHDIRAAEAERATVQILVL
ncbi:hypothetical protein PoB_000149800 [Plakobranchus ocellatus]|uniref:Uncharacterized protein n=1 Tax=Plakobranchus ocellatus TaxID=259542 RepID=A0AAV3XY97_9GAST|nr:hypothetical protein PoB_000149800 [Plakobranchus ocellatus]